MEKDNKFVSEIKRKNVKLLEKKGAKTWLGQTNIKSGAN